jgi:hypothetical protein
MTLGGAWWIGSRLQLRIETRKRPLLSAQSARFRDVSEVSKGGLVADGGRADRKRL